MLTPVGRNLQLISPHRNNPICVASHKEAKTCGGSIIEHCILNTNAGKQQTVLSCHRCLINSGVENMNYI